MESVQTTQHFGKLVLPYRANYKVTQKQNNLHFIRRQVHSYICLAMKVSSCTKILTSHIAISIEPNKVKKSQVIGLNLIVIALEVWEERVKEQIFAITRFVNSLPEWSIFLLFLLYTNHSISTYNQTFHAAHNTDSQRTLFSLLLQGYEPHAKPRNTGFTLSQRKETGQNRTAPARTRGFQLSYLVMRENLSP